MFRLLSGLLVGIGLVMYFADRFPEPVTKTENAANSTATPLVSVTEEIDNSPVPTSARVENLPAQPEIRPGDKPAAAATDGQSLTYAVLFQNPTVIGPDDELRLESVQIQPAIITDTITTGINNDPRIDIRYVTGKRVNVRQGPSTDTSILEQVLFAEAVQVLTDPVEGWVLIRIEGDGVEGYIASRFLQSDDPLN